MHYGLIALLLLLVSVAGSIASYFAETRLSDTNDSLRARTVLELLFSVVFFGVSAAVYANSRREKQEPAQPNAAHKNKVIGGHTARQVSKSSVRVEADVAAGQTKATQPKADSSKQSLTHPQANDRVDAASGPCQKKVFLTKAAQEKLLGGCSPGTSPGNSPEQDQANPCGGFPAHEPKRNGRSPGGSPQQGQAQPLNEEEKRASTYTKYTRLISQCVRQGEGGPRRALDLLKEMDSKGFPPNKISFGAAIGVCAKRDGCHEDAEHLLDMMRKGNLQPDGVCYNAAIAACAKSAKVGKAMDLMRQMREQGVTPTVITYNAAIDACAKAGAEELARQLLQEIRANGLEPDARSYGAAINACVKRGRWEIAVVLLEEMQQFGLTPTVHHFSAAINACSKCGCSGESVQLLDSMRSMDIQPNQICYFTAINSCLKAKDANLGMYLFNQMQQDGITPDEMTRSALIQCLQNSGNVGNAEALSKLMKADKRGKVEH